MTLRVKVLASSVGLTVVAMALLGAIMWATQRQIYLEESRLRARAFLSTLSVAVTRPLAEGHIGDLDSMLGTLMEQELSEVEVRYVVVLDVGGRVVGHTDPAQYGKILAGGFFGEALRTDDVLAREEGNLLVMAMPVETKVPGQQGIRWGTVVAALSLERIHRGLLALLVKVIGAVLIVALVSTTILAALLERQVLRPVRRLTESTKSFAAGNMAVRADVEGTDELGVLGATFNQMANQIATYTEHLEAEIRARTKDLEEANRRLEALAVTDALTRLFNRRRFEEVLALEVQRSQRTNLPLSLLMIDVDHFKHYNDTFGHQAGDEVLQTIATLVKRRIRATDTACRYGGEEFAIILPDTSKDEAMTLAEHLRHIVEAHPFAYEEQQPLGRLTISIGVATYPDDAKDGVSLVRAADQALYLAKQMGRNRVERASSRNAHSL